MNIKKKEILNLGLVIIGGVITAVGLQYFLLPNHLLDGGVTGASIIASEIFRLPIGLFLVIFNAPFIILGYKKFGKLFALYSLVGILTLVTLTSWHISNGFVDQPILAAVFGGMIVGLGVGLVVRSGGILDGADTVAVLIDRTTVFSVGEAILVINAVIITAAGFVFGWEHALYSLIAYFVAHRAIDVTVEGLNESRTMWIVSMKIRAAGREVNNVTGQPVTYVRETDESAREPHGILMAVVTRFEEQKIITAVRTADPYAFITSTKAHEVVGKMHEGSLERSMKSEPV